MPRISLSLGLGLILWLLPLSLGAATPPLPRPAPTFDFPRLDQPQLTFNPASTRGQWQLVNFFASWCAPCLAEHPLLKGLAPHPQLQLVGIAFKDRVTDATAWLTRHGNPYDMVGQDTGAMGGLTWRVAGVPSSFLLNPAGEIIWQHGGPLTATMIEQEILPLLSPPTSTAPAP